MTGRAPAALALLVAGVLTLFAYSVPVGAQLDVTGLNVLTGLGYPAGGEDPMYMIGAGWQLRWADTDWRLHFASASGTDAARPVIDLGLEGNWFQPIAFAGYYEFQGSLSVRQSGTDPFVSALRLQADAVIGTLSGQVVFDSVNAGFPDLPWDVPRRPAPVPGDEAFRRLTVELREQPHRNLNLLREFQWSRVGSGDRDNVLVASGGEIRVGGGWLVGKAGLQHRDGLIAPFFAGGFHARPGAYSYIAVTASTPTAVSAYPTLTAEFEYVGERASFSTTLELALDDDRVLPRLVMQSVPHASGFLWRIGVGPSASGQSTTFGVLTSF